VTANVPGGVVLAWIRANGSRFGVTLLPDGGPGRSFTSAEDHPGFPSSFDPPALVEWGLERWPPNRLVADLFDGVEAA